MPTSPITQGGAALTIHDHVPPSATAETDYDSPSSSPYRPLKPSDCIFRGKTPTIRKQINEDHKKEWDEKQASRKKQSGSKHSPPSKKIR